MRGQIPRARLCGRLRLRRHAQPSARRIRPAGGHRLGRAPERFAVKWNFGCGYNLICTDKQALDTHAAVQQLRAWGREPFWAYYSELQYRHVDKKLLIEEYIGTPGRHAAGGL